MIDTSKRSADPPADRATSYASSATALLESIPTERPRSAVNRLSRTGAGLLLARIATRLDLEQLAKGIGVSASELRVILAGDRGLTAAQQLRLAETAMSAFPQGTDLHRRAAAVRGQVRALYDYELGERQTHPPVRGSKR